MCHPLLSLQIECSQCSLSSHGRDAQRVPPLISQAQHDIVSPSPPIGTMSNMPPSHPTMSPSHLTGVTHSVSPLIPQAQCDVVLIGTT